MRRLPRSEVVNVERNYAVPECVECGARWFPTDDSRWQLREVDLDEFARFCDGCGERQFGEGR